nr:ribonuclease H-like domain-containing protein [Tanacetum cinerariifolium]
MLLKDDKEEDREVADAVKDVENAKVDESAQDQGRQAESHAKIYKIDMDHANRVLSMQEDEIEPTEVEEVVNVVTTAKLITEVVTAASAIITTAEAQVPAVHLLLLLQELLLLLDKGKWISVEEPKPLKKKQQIEQDEQYARELHAELNKDIDWDEAIDHVKLKAKEDPANVASFKMDYFKGMSYDDIRPIFEAKFNSNVAFLLKTKEQIEEDENRALQKLNETPTKRAAKRKKLDEEVEELKRHLQIVPNKDDDVYTEATPLAKKVPVVDYQIIQMKNKPYYKIIRANDTHQLYISFLTLLRNFDREDLEALWSLIITFTSTQLILLVERKYPLTRFTLDQMLNAVRLEVEEESEDYSYMANEEENHALVANDEVSTEFALMDKSSSSSDNEETREKLLRPQLVGFRDLNKIIPNKDSGCSRHMTGNISYLSEYEPYDGGYVSFGHGGGKITGKGIIKTGKLELMNVYFVKELKYNLFSVSQIYDNKNSVLFTDSECLVLGKDFKLNDDTNVLLLAMILLK